MTLERRLTTALHCGARSASELKGTGYLRSMLSHRQLQGFVGARSSTAGFRRPVRVTRMEYSIVPITVKRNGTDVTAGTQLGIWFPGIGCTTYTIMPSSQSTVNRETPRIIKTLRATICVTNDEKNVTANGTSKRPRTVSGVVSSLRNPTRRYPNGMIASLAPKEAMQNVNAHATGRASPMFLVSYMSSGN